MRFRDNYSAVPMHASGESRCVDITDICPRCTAHEAIHPRHPWDCSITPEEWREFYATPWPAIWMWRTWLIASGHKELWP